MTADRLLFVQLDRRTGDLAIASVAYTSLTGDRSENHKAWPVYKAELLIKEERTRRFTSLRGHPLDRIKWRIYASRLDWQTNPITRIAVTTHNRERLLAIDLYDVRPNVNGDVCSHITSFYPENPMKILGTSPTAGRMLCYFYAVDNLIAYIVCDDDESYIMRGASQISPTGEHHFEYSRFTDPIHEGNTDIRMDPQGRMCVSRNIYGSFCITKYEP